MTYDLRDAVNAVLDSGLTDYADIAAKVAENVPSREVRFCLAEALRSYVREQMSHRRAVNPVLKPATSPSSPTSSARSPKRDAIRAQHARFLLDLVHVQDGNKPLGKCTYQDLMFAAEERRQMASANTAMANRYQQITELLRSHDVTTVEELPVAVLRESASA